MSFLAVEPSYSLAVSWFDKVKRSAISLAKISCLLSHKLSIEFYYILIFLYRESQTSNYQASAYFDFHSPFLTRAVNSVLLFKVDTKFGNTFKKRSLTAAIIDAL